MVFTLPADDYRLIHDTRRIFIHRIAGPQREQEPCLVHRVVVVHGAIMGVQAFSDASERGHLIADVPALFLVAIVLAVLMPRASMIAAD